MKNPVEYEEVFDRFVNFCFMNMFSWLKDYQSVYLFAPTKSIGNESKFYVIVINECKWKQHGDFTKKKDRNAQAVNRGKVFFIPDAAFNWNDFHFSISD